MDVGRTCAALADPTRRAVVARLSRGEATVGELAAPHDMSLPAFTKHVATLVDAGLVRRRKVGRTVVCTLAPAPLRDLADWASTTTGYWEATLDRLERVLAEEDR